MDISEGTKTAILSVAAMLTLAGLDLVGALFAKEWADRGRYLWFGFGLASFLVLFIVYARILRVAELSTVTIGWVVFLQVGLVLVDAFRYDVTFPKRKLVAVLAILLLQVYLIATPTTPPDHSTLQSADIPTGINDDPAGTDSQLIEPYLSSRTAGRRLGPRAI